MSGTDADLNAYDGALDYDGHTLHTADPGDDGSNVAAGGSVVAVTMGAPGDAGPFAQHVATPGRSYATAAVTYTLTEAATHGGFWSGGVFRRGYPLRTPVGPGDVVLTPAVQVRNPSA